MEEKRKRRSHAEVVAAREAYAKERFEKAREKEERKRQREKLLEERAERKAERERKKVRKPQPVDSAGNALNTIYGISPWKGSIEVGDMVAIRFVGSIYKGEVESIEDEITSYIVENTENGQNQDMEVRNRYYIVKTSSGYRYPVPRQDILAKKLK